MVIIFHLFSSCMTGRTSSVDGAGVAGHYAGVAGRIVGAGVAGHIVVAGIAVDFAVHNHDGGSSRLAG